MQLSELIAGLDVAPSRGGVGGAGGGAGVAGVRVCDLTEDSRTVVPGSLFIARGGQKADGKAYVRDACKAGAVAILTDAAGLETPAGFNGPVLVAADVPLVTAMIAERFFGRPSRGLRIVGVTGTNGKTTLSTLVWQLLNGAGRRCGLIGTVTIDDGREVAPAAMTTPPAIEISRTLASMVEAGCEAAAMEISSHALDQKRADALRLEVGVFTNLTGDHLDYHKTMDHYAAAKARLFGLLPARGTAIVNAGDPWTPRMLDGCGASVLRCAVGPAGDGGVKSKQDAADCRAEVIECSMQGMVLRLSGPWGEVRGLVPLVGRYNAMNVLQAVASAYSVGLTRDDLERGLPLLTPPPGRLERVSTPGDAVHVFVDYAHSDDSLRNVLHEVAGVMPGRSGAGGLVRGTAGGTGNKPEHGTLWAVFGCGGERDRTKRPRMGAAAAELADRVVVTSDNPRTERPADIINEILAGIPPDLRDRVIVQADRERAIRAAIEAAAPGDVVVIAGKGHETEQILPDPRAAKVGGAAGGGAGGGAGGTITIHFDDREVARAALSDRRPAAEPKPAARATRAASHVGRRSADR